MFNNNIFIFLLQLFPFVGKDSKARNELLPRPRPHRRVLRRIDVLTVFIFSGVGESTHGQHNRLRAPGSIGAGSTPSRVFKGMRMAGRMGGENIKQQNLKVLKINKDNNLVYVSGSVPGYRNSYVTLEK